LTDLPLPQATTFSTLAVHPPNLQHAQPLSYVDIYIDDFLAVAQRSSLLPTLSHTLHGIFSSFHDTQHDRDAPSRQHIISQKKLLKGDATWSTSKLILGWLFNTEDMTISFPPHKADRLKIILHEFHGKTRTSRR